MTVALSHLFFVLVRALIWYPLPFGRAVELSMSKFLGSIAADIGSFLLWYTLYMFVAIHVMRLEFSLASPWNSGVVVIEFVRSRTAAWRFQREVTNYSPHLEVWLHGPAHHVVKQALVISVFTAACTRFTSSETYDVAACLCRECGPYCTEVVPFTVSPTNLASPGSFSHILAATDFWSHLYVIAAQRSCVDEGGVSTTRISSHPLESPGIGLEGDLHRRLRDRACIWPRWCVHSLRRRFALPLGGREDGKVEWYRTEAVTPPRVVGSTPVART